MRRAGAYGHRHGHMPGALKIIVIGTQAVGKSQLVNTFTKKSDFNAASSSTIGVDFSTTVIAVGNGETARCQIWDTAGQERFRSLQASYYRGSDAVMLVYDVSRPATFAELDGWLEDVKKSCDPDPTLLVVGNKADLDSAVPEATARAWSDSHGAIHVYTSAKNGEGVEDAFVSMAAAAHVASETRATSVKEDAVPAWTLTEPRPPSSLCCS